MLPMFQGAFAQTEQLGKLALRKGDLFPDRPDIDVIWNVDFAAVVFLAPGEGEEHAQPAEQEETKANGNSLSEAVRLIRG